jgi:transposase
VEAHVGKAEQLTKLCVDIASAYRRGAERYFSPVPLTYDRYHLMQNLNHALDEVRRQEQENASELKRSRYLWLKNASRLSAGQRRRLAELRKEHGETAEAYRIKLAFQEFYAHPAEYAELYLPTGWRWR